MERLEREKEETKEEHSLSLQKLRANLRQQAEKHSQEILQAELEHKVIDYWSMLVINLLSNILKYTDV